MYELNYSDRTGKVSSIQCGNMSIPLCEANTDYQDFLKWNSEQNTPLDLKSTIPVIPPKPARNLAAEVDKINLLLRITKDV